MKGALLNVVKLGGWDMVEVTSFLRQKSLAVLNRIWHIKEMVRNDWTVINQFLQFFRKSSLHYLVHHDKIHHYYIASGNGW